MALHDILPLIGPELALLLTILVALIVELTGSPPVRLAAPWIGIAGLLVSLYLLVKVPWASALTIFSGSYTVDPFSAFFKVTAIFTGILVILLSIEFADRYIKESRNEFFVLMLFSVLAIMMVVSSTDLLMVFLSIEFLSLISYLVAGYMKSDRLSAEASLKYLLFGLVASGIMLYGISLLYGMTGTLNIYDLADLIKRGDLWVNSVALVFLLAGFGFKIALVPFHQWAPDVYEGAPTPMTAFFSVGPKLAGFAVLCRVLIVSFGALAPDWISLLGFVAVMSMTLGNIVAISQKELKRMLAYSSIAQAGTILIGLAAVASGQGLSSVMIYLFIYSFMNLGTFAVVIAIANETGSTAIDQLRGLSRRNPFLAFTFTVFLFSLAGLPPLGGFVAKFLVFAAAVESKNILLAVAGVVNSVIAVFYYLNLVRMMYIVPAPEQVPFHPARTLRLAILLALVMVLATGIFPAPLIHWVSDAHLLAPL